METVNWTSFLIGEDGSGNIELQTNLATLNKNIFKLKNVDFDFADYNNDGQSDMIIAGEIKYW